MTQCRLILRTQKSSQLSVGRIGIWEVQRGGIWSQRTFQRLLIVQTREHQGLDWDMKGVDGSLCIPKGNGSPLVSGIEESRVSGVHLACHLWPGVIFLLQAPLAAGSRLQTQGSLSCPTCHCVKVLPSPTLFWQSTENQILPCSIPWLESIWMPTEGPAWFDWFSGCSPQLPNFILICASCLGLFLISSIQNHYGLLRDLRTLRLEGRDGIFLGNNNNPPCFPLSLFPVLFKSMSG